MICNMLREVLINASAAPLRAPPPCTRGRGKTWKCVLAARSRPRCLFASLRGAVATKQSSGAMQTGFVVLLNLPAALDCFATARKDDQGKKGSGTPTNVCPTSAPLRARRAPFLFPLPRLRGRVGRGHARLSAFHRGSCVSERTPTLSSRPGFLGRGRTLDPVSSLQPGSEDLALLNGRYPRPPVPVQGTHLPGRS